MDSSETQNYTVVLVGSDDVGKQRLLLGMTEEDYVEAYINTLGRDFLVKTFTIQEREVSLKVFDTPDLEEFQALLPVWVLNCDCCIMVYSNMNRNSYTLVADHMEDIKKWNAGCQVVLLSNDMKQGDEEPCVKREEGEKLASAHKFGFLEVNEHNRSELHNLLEIVAKSIYFNKL